jgi:hypothetical protein
MDLSLGVKVCPPASSFGIGLSSALLYFKRNGFPVVGFSVVCVSFLWIHWK